MQSSSLRLSRRRAAGGGVYCGVVPCSCDMQGVVTGEQPVARSHMDWPERRHELDPSPGTNQERVLLRFALPGVGVQGDPGAPAVRQYGAVPAGPSPG